MRKVKLFVIYLIVIFSLTGCGYKDKQLARKRVGDFLDGYQQKNESISGYLLGTDGDADMGYEGISAYFAEKLEYEVKSCKKEESDIYCVEVEIKTIDFEKLFTLSYEETVESYGEEIEENFLKQMEQNVEKGEYETYTSDCEVYVRKIDDEFKIQMDSSFANALTGGMNQYLNSLQGGK